MTISRGQKRIISLLLALAVILTLFSFATGSFSAATATLSYSFSNTAAGYAEGTVTLNGSGTYWLYWADDTKALDGFYPVATLTANGSKSHSMHAQTAIPADATKLIAISSSTEPSNKSVSAAAAVYDIPSSKRLGHTSGERRYRFMSYSDVHFDALYRTYKYDETHWAHALQTAANRNVDFMVGSGDYINNNIDYPEPWTDEWARYEKILAESDYCNPVYEAIGNHELWHDVDGGIKTFIKETGLEGSNGSSPNAYFEKTLNGDHFIFMALEGGFFPNSVSEFTTAQLNWLEGLLQKYTGDGHNIYIIEHSLFYKYGAGDRTDGEPYYDIPLSDSYPTTARLKTLLQTYKDAIFITGHTHIAFSYQYNYSDNGGTSAQMIHNSSVGGVRHVGTDGKLTHDYKEDETEGYIVDVFDNGILFYGTNLFYDKIDPNCSYIVKTSQQIAGGETPTQGTTAPTPTIKPTTAQPTTAQPTTAPPTTTPPTTAPSTGYYLKGSFNNWGTANPFHFTQDSDVISQTMTLAEGTYTFNINNGSTTLGNNGIIQETTKATSQGGWEMTTGANNCTLVVNGGTYTFNFILSSKKLNVLSSNATPSATAYYLKGSFNSWGTGNPFYTTPDSNIISVTMPLSAGTYTFKINSGSSWYGNGGTIDNTTKKTSQGGWEMTTSAGDCTLKASGGIYTFNFILSSKKLNVLYTSTATTNKIDSASVSAGKTYYLFGYINGADYADKDDYQNMGSYQFVNGTVSATFTQDSYVGVKEANNAAWYMTNGYAGSVQSVTLYNTNNLGSTADKLYVPAGKVKFTLVENSNGTLTLSYTKDEPTTAAPVTVAPTTAAPTTTPAPTYQLGDANGDGKINIKDVTAIQRHIAQIEYLDSAKLKAAKVRGESELTINDATTIQKYLVQLIDAFPAEQQPTQPTTDGTSDAEKTALLNTVQTNLSTYYRYASYDCYQALKKEYRADAALKNAGNLAQINAATLQALNAALLSVVDPSNVDSASTTRTVYFENTNNWSTVKAYVWGNQGAGNTAEWPGQNTVYVGTNEYGHAVYSVTVTDPRYKNVIFNNGDSLQTQDLRIYRDNLAFYISDGGSSPYYCKGYIFKSSYVNK